MKANKKTPGLRNVQLIAVAIWFSASVLGTLVYMISGTFDNFTDALFESASGFTTTGATVISDFSAVSPAILFFRSLI